MPLRFRIRTLSGAGQSTERLLALETTDDQVFVGRYRGSQIELPLPAVSGRHARLWRTGEGWRVEDLGSANGTFRNGCRLVPQRPEPLLPGDVLGVVGVEVVFEGEDRVALVAGDARVESTCTLARRLVSDLFGSCRAAEVPRLLCPEGSSEVLRLGSLGRCYSVGRGAACDLVLADEDVSRGHAELERRGDGVYLRDLGSKNGTLLDGQRVNGQTKVRDGALLIIGKTELRFEDPEERYLKQLAEAEAKEAAEAAAEATSAASPPTSAPSPAVALPESPSASRSDETRERKGSESGRAASSNAIRRTLQGASRFRPALAVALAAVVLLGVAAAGFSLLLGLWK